ncbi:molybdopterin synthase subunit MoaD [Orbus hercynius]|uniref:Molybdopterin synthase sulfur carrier subunit n=1 Tax=Orbus hercynius TaxID=593135 RepID=A0A495RC90_9GAMM|nr:MoaD/ThiS family protein [Orbus hercynius]RKS85092.1 molybdopterin synthase subunit MoaD [Orbus hercynius]
MIRILFFAQTRELIGVSSLELDMAPIAVSDLIEHLSLNGDNWLYALKEKHTLCAVNKQLVDHNYVINANDEVAFFPPVTGG